MPEDLSASNFCKDRFCENDIDPKIRVPSVPSVPQYRSTLGTRTFQSVSLSLSMLLTDTPFRALKINGSENRKDFDRRTKPFHEIVLL